MNPFRALINRYKISKPNEYLLRTGLGITDILVTKKGVQWPFQDFKFIRMDPRQYGFELHAMSSEKVDFVLPGVFTIGPKIPDNNDTTFESIKKYARTVENSEELEILTLGIIEGMTRELSASMTIEEIFNNRKIFKTKILENVQTELDDLGLFIYNANIKELDDANGYFNNMRQKKLAEAEFQAKIDIAEERKKGDVGEKERVMIMRQRVAELESKAVRAENERQQEIEKSNAELNVIKANTFKLSQLAKINAENETKMKAAELETQVENKKIELNKETIRAKELSQTTIDAEKMIKEAEGKANAIQIEADARLFAKQKEADGILAIYNAQSTGVNNLIATFNGDSNALLKYLMIQNGLYEKLAEQNAQAIKGLNPKITNYNMIDERKNTESSISNIMAMLPPILDTINSQTKLNS